MNEDSRLFPSHLPWFWIIFVAGALVYFPFIGGVHLFDWDEINFAEIAREMISTGDYLTVQIDYKPFFEKPPFFFWLQAMSMHVFGVNEFAARLPNAMCGLIVLVLIYKLGTRWVNQQFGLVWALSYFGSLLPVLYHKSGIIDPWFNLFIFSSIACWAEGAKRSSSHSIYLLSGILSGLAVLTKGPVGPLIIGLSILAFRIFSGNRLYLRLNSVLLFIAGTAGIASLWFGLEWVAHGPDFIRAFIAYQIELLSKPVAGHSGFPGYHFVVALFGIFPASIFALYGFRKKQVFEVRDDWDLRLLMIILTLIVLVLFTVVKSKIVHYSSLAYYPVSFLSAWSILNIYHGNIPWKKGIPFVGVIATVIIGLLLFLLPVTGINIEQLKAQISLDEFTKSAISADVHWSILDFIPFVFFVSIISAFLFFRKKNFRLSILLLFGGVAILMNLFLIFFIGKMEHYAQRAAIEFYKSKEGVDVDVKTLGFKSYAPFFYAKKPVPENDINRKTFYVLKADKRHLLDQYPNLREIYHKNGYIFLE